MKKIAATALVTAVLTAGAAAALGAGSAPSPIGTGSVTSTVAGPGPPAPPSEPSVNELYLRVQTLEQRVSRLEYCAGHPRVKGCRKL